MSYDKTCECGAAIRFERAAVGGKSIPISLATGRSHFEDCPLADKFRADSAAEPSSKRENLCAGSHGKPAIAPPGALPRGRALPAPDRGRCAQCGREYSLTKHGRIFEHAARPSAVRAERAKPKQMAMFE